MALDWLLDRCITALNVAGDTVVTRIVDDLTSKSVAEDVESGPDASDLSLNGYVAELEDSEEKKLSA